MSFTRTQVMVIVAGAVLMLIVILLLIFGLRDSGVAGLSGTVNFWGVFDEPISINRLIADYKKIQPNINVVYRKLDSTSYEQDLINGLAGVNGPDLFMMHNTWLPKHYGKIRPLDDGQLNLTDFQSLFPTVVEQDFAPDGVIFGLPLYLDTLALFYNKDYFDAKGVALPPKTWEEFQSLVPRLVELDSSGKVVRAAAAIGGSNRSINRATDLLNILMLQSGAEMVNSSFRQAEFASAQGVDSLRFYTKFANPVNNYYTWNENLHYSLDNFSEGSVAMIFNYAYQVPLLEEKNPFLRFEVATIPQPTGASQPINFANYWGLATSIKSSNPAAAWDFAIYLTTNLEAQHKYLDLTQKPPALRSLIDGLLSDNEWGVFAKQALTARSWPQIDNNIVEQEFSAMIAAVISGQKTPEKAIQEAEEKITFLMERNR
ncbi:MAG: extracellular solute-binding protein [bacterium]|nr:extracellular solute-binding protein [bacterium]